MADLKPCPCGETPKELGLNYNGQGSKWATAVGTCCGEWEVEFRTGYEALDSEKCMEYALEAWNRAPRADTDEPTGATHVTQQYGTMTIPEMMTVIRNRDKQITKLEDLFLLMYELGSSDPFIEESVEKTVARIVERQDGGK